MSVCNSARDHTVYNFNMGQVYTYTAQIRDLLIVFPCLSSLIKFFSYCKDDDDIGIPSQLSLVNQQVGDMKIK